MFAAVSRRRKLEKLESTTKSWMDICRIFKLKTLYNNTANSCEEENIMKKLFDAANRYIETSDWKIIAVLKFCLISLGMMIGMTIDKKDKKTVFLQRARRFHCDLCSPDGQVL